MKKFRPTTSLSLISLIVVTFVLTDLSCTTKEEYSGGSSSDTPQSTFTIPTLTGNVPVKVNIPSKFNGTPEEARPFFDIFSWEMFIALNWPVIQSERGAPQNPNEPSTFLNMTNTTPVVWASYKNQFELFGQEDNRPSAWDSFDNPINLCPDVNHVFGTAKGNTLDGGDIDEAFSYPLIDQNKNYALFEMRYNEMQYDFVRGSDSDPTSWLYLLKNLVKKQISVDNDLQMPISTDTQQGAIMVKAAWKELDGADDPSKFYVINENVYDPTLKTCTTKQMGLVGIHLVQKVQGFSQWIWSSFEHRNNVPGQGSQTPYSFNNGTDSPTTTGGWADRPSSTSFNPDKASRVPTQVSRYNEIPTTPAGSSTVDINAAYQKLLANTVWSNYQLVITQWPTDDTSFVPYGKAGTNYPESSGKAFPVLGCTNTSAETYFQSSQDATGKGGNSCMSCHYMTSKSDFSWSLQQRAH